MYVCVEAIFFRSVERERHVLEDNQESVQEKPPHFRYSPRNSDVGLSGILPYNDVIWVLSVNRSLVEKISSSPTLRRALPHNKLSEVSSLSLGLQQRNGRNKGAAHISTLTG